MKDRYDAGRTRELFLPSQGLTRDSDHAIIDGEVEKHSADEQQKKRPATEIFDRGRRGEPLLGCDCMQCFGYCLVDHDVARRDLPDSRTGYVNGSYAESIGPIEEEL